MHKHKATQRRRINRVRVSAVTLLCDALGVPRPAGVAEPLPVSTLEVIAFCQEVIAGVLPQEDP